MRRFGHNLLIRGGLRAYALTLPFKDLSAHGMKSNLEI